MRGERFFFRKRDSVLPKITGKMKAASYGLVLTRVIEQMEAVSLNTVKAGTESSRRNVVERAGPHLAPRFTNNV